MKFPSLSALIKDYQLAYENCWHVLKKVYVGFPFRHEPMSVAPIKWRVLNLRVDKHPWEEVSDSLDTCVRIACMVHGCVGALLCCVCACAMRDCAIARSGSEASPSAATHPAD